MLISFSLSSVFSIFYFYLFSHSFLDFSGDIWFIVIVSRRWVFICVSMYAHVYLHEHIRIYRLYLHVCNYECASNFCVSVCSTCVRLVVCLCYFGSWLLLFGPHYDRTFVNVCIFVMCMFVRVHTCKYMYIQICTHLLVYVCLLVYATLIGCFFIACMFIWMYVCEPIYVLFLSVL